MDIIEPVSSVLPYHVSIGGPPPLPLGGLSVPLLLAAAPPPPLTPSIPAPPAGNHEYDYPPSQDGAKDPSGAGAMWSPPWWNGGSDSGGECGMPTARRFRTPVSQAADGLVPL